MSTTVDVPPGKNTALDWRDDPRFGTDDNPRGSLADLEALIERRLTALSRLAYDDLDQPGGIGGLIFRAYREICRWEVMTGEYDSFAAPFDEALCKAFRLPSGADDEWAGLAKGEEDDPYERLVSPHVNAATDSAGAYPWRLPTLADLLAQEDTEPVYRIDRAWPTGGTVVLSAPQKAGKTTAVGNIVRSLADGVPLFGPPSDTIGRPDGFAVTALGRGEVFLADFESTPQQLRRWLSAHGIRATERVNVELLRGRAGAFDVRDATVRRTWARQLRIQNVRVVIVDCLGPLAAALGIDIRSDVAVGPLLAGFDALLRESGAAELLVIHHTTHTSERSAGSMRLRAWPDVEWHLTVRGDPATSPRFFSAFGRDVAIEETALVFDKATRHLSLGVGDRSTHQPQARTDLVAELVEATPGIPRGKLERTMQTTHGGSTPEVRRAIDTAVEVEAIHVHPASNRRQLHYVGPASDGCHGGSSKAVA